MFGSKKRKEVDLKLESLHDAAKQSAKLVVRLLDDVEALEKRVEQLGGTIGKMLEVMQCQ